VDELRRELAAWEVAQKGQKALEGSVARAEACTRAEVRWAHKRLPGDTAALQQQ
jgi:hypothetical protein